MPQYIPVAPPQRRWRAHVGGLFRGKVGRLDGRRWLQEENSLGEFFWDECNLDDDAIVSIYWAVDDRTRLSRGFAFVEFKDEESLRRAIAQDGKVRPRGVTAGAVPMNEATGGILRVSPAQESKEAERSDKLTLRQERDKTEGLEKDLRGLSGRINEKMEQISSKRSRQKMLQAFLRGKEDQLHDIRKRQREISELMSKLQTMEKSLDLELDAENARTEVLEDVEAEVDLERWADMPDSPDWDNAPAADVVAWPAVADLAQIAPEAVELHRTISNRPADEAPVPAPVRAEDGTPPVPPPSWHPEELARQLSWSVPQPAVLIRQQSRTPSASPSPVASPSGAASGTSDVPTGAVSSTSAADVSRNILDVKMGVCPVAEASQEAEDDHSDVGRPGVFGPAASTSGKDAMVKGLPPGQGEDELRAGLGRELERLWRAMGMEPPKVASMEVQPATSWADKAAGRTGGASIHFEDPLDAWLLVERCGACTDASSSLNPSMHGRRLQIGWPAKAPIDLPKMRHCAASDQSSNFTYETGKGSNQTHFSAFRQQGQGGGAGQQGGAARAPTKGGRGVEEPPVQNRTVLLSGVPTDMKTYDVRKDVLKSLQLRWRQGGSTFAPREDLHKGHFEDPGDGKIPEDQAFQSGVFVFPPRGRGENGGSVRLRFRRYMDAAWLVEQRGLRVAGCTLKAAWATPRPQEGQLGASVRTSGVPLRVGQAIRGSQAASGSQGGGKGGGGYPGRMPR